MERDVILGSRILILDDQEANVLLLERLLQMAGYKNYVSLTDSRELLDQFRLHQPDLILLDLMMPKLDGYAVMKQLTGWLPTGTYLPIMVITADVSRTSRQKALSLGAKDFLTKPIDATEATQRIYNLLFTRQLCRQMDERTRRSEQQAAESISRIALALREVEALTARGQLQGEDLELLRLELRHTLEALNELASGERDALRAGAY
jgi:PleD family two-component response regulator